MTCQMQMIQLEENYQGDVVCFWLTQKCNNAESNQHSEKRINS